MTYWVYILSSKPLGTLYLPMTQEGPIDPAIMGPGLPLRENRDDT
jgi:hypothetical protein